MARTLRSFVSAFDRVSSQLLGRDGSVRNIRDQLDDHQRAVEQIEVLRHRLAATQPHRISRAA